MEASNLAKNSLVTQISSFILCFIVLKIAGYEIAVIFSISLLIGFVVAGFNGIENMIILVKEGKKKEEE